MVASTADSGMDYLTHQVRKRVGHWSNRRRIKDILRCLSDVRFTPESGHVQCALYRETGVPALAELHCYCFSIGALGAFKRPVVAPFLIAWVNLRKKHWYTAFWAPPLSNRRIRRIKITRLRHGALLR